jgi:cellulose synthase/poly-beta-1,6-N-acetylglucosamine synthase-like glycosyltransferase
MNVFFVVLARDKAHVEPKVKELERLNVPHVVICGEDCDVPNVHYRRPQGKYDAINYSRRFIPDDCDVVVYNDVDTTIFNFPSALPYFHNEKTAMVFSKVVVRKGPQTLFYKFLDSIRRRLPVTASGEMILVRSRILERILPLKPCKAEDSYMLLKVLSLKYRVVFCERAYVETERTQTIENEELYKRKTVAGLYQALSYTKPPTMITFFYLLLPFVSPLLLLMGRKGYYWTKGILLGFLDYLRGDRRGSWETTYLGGHLT